jgi:hypothetical protein
MTLYEAPPPIAIPTPKLRSPTHHAGGPASTRDATSATDSNAARANDARLPPSIGRLDCATTDAVTTVMLATTYDDEGEMQTAEMHRAARQCIV